MPGRNRTGPSGHGRRTGRGLGACSSGEHAMVETNGRCLGHGAGRGARRRGHCFGHGQGRMFDATSRTDMTAEQETVVLKDQVAFLETQTDAVKRRIDELKAQQGKNDLKEES